MEAVWSRCFPIYDELRNILAKGTIGEVLYLRANMGLKICDVPRIKKAEYGGGTVLDLGVYVLQLATLIFGNKPSKLIAIGDLNDDGVDENVDYILKYPNGKTANLCTHSKIQMDNSAFIYGTKGYVKIDSPFWCPTVMTCCGEEKQFPLPFKCNKMNHQNSEGLMYEAMEVRNCLKKGLIESPKMSHEDSLTLAKLEEEVFDLLGIKFD